VSDAPYREPTPDGYLAAWDDLRRRRRASLAALAGSAAAAGGVIGATVLTGAWGLVVLVPACAMLTPLLAVSKRGAHRFMCPACGKPFTRLANGFHNDFTRRCLHCGIAIGTLKGAP